VSNLFHLLTNLAIEPKKESVFINNPKLFMDEVGLSEAEQALILSQESTKIAALFADEQVELAISAADPGPDPLPDPDPFPIPDPGPSPPTDVYA
jgi:hypothetical protein